MLSPHFMKKYLFFLLLLNIISIPINAQTKKYDEIITHPDGSSWVRIGKKWGIIDSTGKIILDTKYDTFGPVDDYNWNGVSELKDGLIAVQMVERMGYV